MKTIIVVMMVVLGIVGGFAQGSITNVDILPEEPTEIDLITIFVSGGEPYSGVLITDSIFNIEDSLLELDLFLTVGVITVPTSWTYLEDIGTLAIGNYDLTVNTFFEFEPILNDTFYTTFEVVPEPTTVLFLALGMAMVRNTRK